MSKTKIQLIIIFILIIILCIISYFLYGKSNKGNNQDMSKVGGMESTLNESTTTKGATEITDEQTLEDNYDTSEADTATIKVYDGGNATINEATINKSGGDSSDTESADFYGGNAGILVDTDGTATIKNTDIKTSAKGGNAVFAHGENAKIYISDSNIETTGESSSRGLDATYGGYIEADNVTIKTNGGSCAALATDRGEGTVIAKNSNLETNGSGSPVIYSTGDISIEDTTGVANGAQMVVVEGKNTATVTNSKLKASGRGNRNDVDNAGIMIYQSMSGDAGEGTGTFTAKDSTLEIDSNSDYYENAPLFFITNTKAIINLENNEIIYGSNTLFSIKGTSEWGNSGSNGGDVTLNATNQQLEGNIELDNISTMEINLKDDSELKSTINSSNTAKSVTLNLDSSSKLILTGDCYITELNDDDSSYSNIEFNGYTIYVNGTAITK